ncbi:MAG TPA: GNAT family N-acetyltransferase [Candidatus Magasanikbacteria bacterium]|nr:GNAT family N-acetyltransferase [Candidatus Magasanikbacteria bacterium]
MYIPNIVITIPTLNEWKEVRALRLQALKNEPHAFKNGYHEEIQLTENEWKKKIYNSSRNNRDEFFIIAKVDNRIVGMVGADLRDEKTWCLKSVFVAYEYRGQGIGTRLLEEVIEKLERNYHARMIELTVNILQIAAIRVYTKCGFVVREIMENQESGDGKKYTKFNMYRNFCPITMQGHVNDFEKTLLIHR